MTNALTHITVLNTDHCREMGLKLKCIRTGTVAMVVDQTHTILRYADVVFQLHQNGRYACRQSGFEFVPVRRVERRIAETC